jgi:hypothetical protein
VFGVVVEYVGAGLVPVVVVEQAVGDHGVAVADLDPDAVSFAEEI